jgi:ATP-dependent Lon protease
MQRLELPIVAINAVVFPGAYLRMIVTNASLRKAHTDNKGKPLEHLGLVANKDRNETFEVGTLVSVLRQKPVAQGSLISYFFHKRFKTSAQDFATLVVIGVDRFRILSRSTVGGVPLAAVELIKDMPCKPHQSLVEELRSVGISYLSQSSGAESTLTEKIKRLTQEGDLSALGFKVAGYLEIPRADKQGLLEETDLEIRTARIFEIVRGFTGRSKGLRPLAKLSGTAALQEKLDSLTIEPESKEAIQQELTRLRSLNPMSAEHPMLRNYLETVLSLPWNSMTTDNFDLAEAQRVLDRDHYGLDRIKRKVIEFLVVRGLNGNSKGSIMCFLGPPGVGKTSLGKSIADALGRKFIRVSLGGVRDEAEIRGHRRTYIGALPGTLINALRSTGSKNPVILLDEIDKVGRDRGDPASALLEVLDPCQNHAFKDHYIALPFDLSNVLFIATANSLETVPPPLQDRMEIVQLTGYSLAEKLSIAKAHLIERQVKENGISHEVIAVSDAAIERIVLQYTREAGVRQLERAIGSLCRAVAVDFSRSQAAKQQFTRRSITETDVEEILGVSLYDDDLKARVAYPGVALGLAWTPYGGKVLLVESSKSPGSGQLRITGQLGEVMKESVSTALSWIKSTFQSLLPNFSASAKGFQGLDLHVHFPAAAVPKDGPSAGVTVITALVSLLLGIRVRDDTAMTGEVSLKGVVLPVGGIKDKVLAAHQQGIKRVIIPASCLKYLKELPESVKQDLEFLPVHTASEVLLHALESPSELSSSLLSPKL